MTGTLRVGVTSGLSAGVSLLVAGAVAWVAGIPALFPSLGPTAYVLAVRPGTPTTRPRRVIGGHAVGVLGGLVAHWLVAPPAPTASLAALPPAGSVPGARLAAAGVLSVALTTAGMVAADLKHAPACATTLIVSLGLLATLAEGVLILVSVATVLLSWESLDRVGRRLGPADP